MYLAGSRSDANSKAGAGKSRYILCYSKVPYIEHMFYYVYSVKWLRLWYNENDGYFTMFIL